MAVRYNDLLTVSELQEDAFSSSSFLDNLTPSDTSAVERLIASATGRIERFLDRQLIVRRYKTFRPDWAAFEKRDPEGSDNTYVAWARQWPVVEIETSSPTVKVHEEADRLLSGQKPANVDLFAGYRREGQTLATLQGEMPDLSVLPETLPYDIREVCSNLVLHRVVIGESSLLGLREKQASVGGQSVSIRSADRSFVRRQLQALTPYRYIHV